MSHATGETLYRFRMDTKPVYQRERANLSQLAAYDPSTGALAAPASGTYYLYAPRDELDAATPVSTGAVVVTGSIAQYNIPAVDLPSTVALGPDYLEVWELVMPDGLTYKLRRPVVVGRFQLFPPIAEADLVGGEYPDLLRNLGASGATVLQGLMDGAWKSIIRHLEAHGRWPDVIVDPSDVFDWHRHETLRRAFGAMLMRQDNQRWTELLQLHRDEAVLAKNGLRITADRDRDGRPDDFGKESVILPIVPNVPPRRRLRSKKWG